MSDKPVRPYGLWPSPITPRSLAEERRLDGVCFDSDGGTLVWLEGRSGHGVLLAQRPGGDAPRELAPEWSVRAEVGYGGGDFTVHGGAAYFIAQKSGRLCRVPLCGGAPRPITPAFGKAASPEVSPDGRWVVYVHSDENVDRLAVVDSQGSAWPQVLAAGRDFYMQPRISRDGRRLAFIAWDQPNMPWDGAELFVADIEYNDNAPPRLANLRCIAGGPEVAVFQPEFSTNGNTLFYVCDESGWGRLMARDLSRDDHDPEPADSVPLLAGKQCAPPLGTACQQTVAHEAGQTVAHEARCLTPEDAEYSTPAWVHGLRTYAVESDGEHIVAVRSRLGFHRLERIELATGRRTTVEPLVDYGELSYLCASPAGSSVAVVASGPQSPARVLCHDFQSGATRVVARASSEAVPPAALAACEALSWPTGDGSSAYGLFYAPAGGQCAGSGKPPLVVLIHGGPTAQFRAGWSAQAQFFATRGYAVLAVNYRGSTGYGRPYMLALRGNWGVCDVEDAISGMQYLAQSGRIDPDRTVLMGGSAGGFTVLQAMVEQPEAFTAGICLYGVANHFDLANDTHKFEARYLDSLLGPLPECAQVYRDRSPIFHADRIRRPLAIFQGDIDRVVPRQQSDTIVEALKRNGTPHVYHVYEGEGHGWRKRETIEHFYRTVESFLKQYVLFT